MLEKQPKNLEICCFRNVVSGLLVSTLLAVPVAGQATAAPSEAKAIISPAVPTDSRGETVYEVQGEHEQDLPVIAGVLLRPFPVKVLKPKYPKSLKGSHSSADVVVEGIVTPSGEFIDAKIIGESDSEASANALAAVSRYKFNPARLDGKPVAFRTRVIVSFHYR